MTGEQNVPNNTCANQAELIRSLKLRELAQLDERLFPPPPAEPHGWAAFVRQHRLTGDDVLQTEISTSSPIFPECPNYDAERGPAAYLDNVRETLLAAPLTRLDHSRPRMLISKRWAYERAARYVFHETEYGQDPTSPFDDLKRFLGKNLLHITSAAYVIADREHARERSRLFAMYLPELTYQSRNPLKSALAAGEVTLKQVETTKEALRQVPYRAPIADFFRLGHGRGVKQPDALQDEIIATVCEEWRELCELLHEVDPNLLQTRANRTSALAYLPLRELSAVIDTNTNPHVPHVEPADICKTFLRSPRTFRQKFAGHQV